MRRTPPPCRSCERGPLKATPSGLVCQACGARHESPLRLAAYPWPALARLRTKLERVELTCAGCSHEFGASIAVFINVAEHPAFETQLAQDRLNETACPSCGLKGSVLAEGTIWFDPASWLIVEAGPKDAVGRPNALPEFNFRRIRIEAGDVFALRATIWKHKIWPTPYGPNQSSYMELSALRQWLLDAGIVLPWFDCFILTALFARQTWRPAQLVARFGPMGNGARAGIDRLHSAGFVIGDLDGIDPAIGLDAQAIKAIEHPGVWFKDHEVIEPDIDDLEVGTGALPFIVSMDALIKPRKCSICARPTPCPTHDRFRGGR